MEATGPDFKISGMAVMNLDPKGTRKLRILCLHGFRQSASGFKGRTNAFCKRFKDIAEFIFIDAPHVLPFYFKLKDGSELSSIPSMHSMYSSTSALSACCEDSEGDSASTHTGATTHIHQYDMHNLTTAFGHLGMHRCDTDQQSAHEHKQVLSVPSSATAAVSDRPSEKDDMMPGLPPTGARKRAWMLSPELMEAQRQGLPDTWQPAPAFVDSQQHLSQTEGWSTSRDYLVSVLQQHAPIDGMLGFSQGAGTAALLCSHLLSIQSEHHDCQQHNNEQPTGSSQNQTTCHPNCDVMSSLHPGRDTSQPASTTSNLQQNMPTRSSACSDSTGNRTGHYGHSHDVQIEHDNSNNHASQADVVFESQHVQQHCRRDYRQHVDIPHSLAQQASSSSQQDTNQDSRHGTHGSLSQGSTSTGCVGQQRDEDAAVKNHHDDRKSIEACKGRGTCSVRFVILASGYVPPGEEAAAQLQSCDVPLPIPSLHLFGGESGWDRQIGCQASEELVQLFTAKNRVVHKHGTAHLIPATKEHIQVVRDFLQHFL